MLSEETNASLPRSYSKFSDLPCALIIQSQNILWGTSVRTEDLTDEL